MAALTKEKLPQPSIAPTPSSVPASVSATPSPNIVATPAPAPSQSNNQGVTVYGTKTGAKYHADGCRYLAKSKMPMPMSISDAKSKGLTACSGCGPTQ